MATEEKTIRITGNESNNVMETEAGSDTPAANLQTTAEKARAAEQYEASFTASPNERRNDELTANDGSLIETLDTALHGEPGVAEGENRSGSDRAAYYEAPSQGKTDVEEELDILKNTNLS